MTTLGRSLCLLGLVATAAGAETWKGRVLLDGAPAAKIEVRAWAALPNGVPKCEKAGPGAISTQCLCPEFEQDFKARLLAGIDPRRAPVTTVITAADGTFTLELPGPKASLLASSADGKLLAEGWTLGPHDLELKPAAPIQLRFKGKTAKLHAWLLHFSSGELERLEPKDGAWVSRPTSHGMRFLFVTADGAQSSMQMLFDGRPMPMAMNMGRQAGDAVIELGPMLPIRGSVLDHGRPAAGVEVVSEPAGCAVTTHTDGKGEFELPFSVTRPYLTTVVAHAKGKFDKKLVAAGGTVQLELADAARLELTVVDDKGAPIPDVAVHASGPGNESLNTDAAGKGSVELAARELTLSVDAPWQLRDAAPFTAAGVVKKTLVLERGVSISGRIVDPHGGLPGKHSVQAKPIEAPDPARLLTGQSDETGAFKIEGLKPGRYFVSLFGEGDTKVEATAPGEVELKAEVAHFLSGHVADPTGKPIKGAHVNARGTGELTNFSYGAVSDEKGDFRFNVKGPATWNVNVTSGDAPAKTAVVELGSGPSAPLKFEFPAVKQLAGKVVDAEGKPVAEVFVEATMMGVMPGMDPLMMLQQAKMMGQYASATSAPDGSFELPLTSSATLFVNQGSLAVEPIRVEPGKPTVLVLKKRAMVTGRVIDASGRPVGHFWVNGTEVFDPAGHFEVPVPSSRRGPPELGFTSESAPDERRVLELAEGQLTLELPDVRLRRGLRLAGTVLDAVTGKPAHTNLEVKAGDVSVGRAAVQPDGSFEVLKVPEGPVKVKLESEEYSPLEVAAKAGQTDLKLKLSPRPSLEVTVTMLSEGYEGVEVVLRGSPGVRRNERPDSDGRVVFARLEPGEYMVSALHFGNQGPEKKVVLKPGAKAKLQLETR